MKSTRLLSRVSEADLRLLHVFVAITESGGLAAAALRLNLSLSVISRHLKELESRLGVRLCERGRGGFLLSGDGQIVYEAARTVLTQIESFRSTVAALHTVMRGELNIAIFEQFASNPQCHLARAVALFSAEALAVTINVHVAVSTEIEKGLVEGRFQVGIQPFHRASDSYLWTSLFTEQMYLYCSHQHPLAQTKKPPTQEEIRRAALVSLGFHSANMEALWRMGLRPAAKAYGQEGTLTLIASGRYIGFLPEHYAAQWETKGELRRLAAEAFHYLCDWGVLTLRTPRPGRLASKFVEMIIQAHSGHAGMTSELGQNCGVPKADVQELEADRRGNRLARACTEPAEKSAVGRLKEPERFTTRNIGKRKRPDETRTGKTRSRG
jgi:DNA-binding transcriptional LysR family regulator